MFNYLKGELFKLSKRKFLYISILFSFIYVIYVYFLYHKFGISKIITIKSLNEECFYLYLTLSIIYTSFNLNEEYEYGTIFNVNNIKLLFAKYLILIVYLLFILILVFITSLILNLLFYNPNFKNIIYYTNYLKEYLKYFPCLLIINLIGFLASLIAHKSFISITGCYLLYIGSNYLNNYIFKHTLKYLYYIPTFFWNYNNIIKNTNIFIGYLLLVLFILLISFISINIIKHCRK